MTTSRQNVVIRVPPARAQTARGAAGVARPFLVNSAAVSATASTSSTPTSDAIDPARIRAAVFDYGGVLIAGGPSDVAAFGGKTGLSEDIWRPLRRQFFGNDGIWAQLERGEVPYEDFTAALRRAIHDAGGTVSEQQAVSFMGSPDPMGQRARLRPQMLDAVRRIRTVMPTALLTNNVKEWRAEWEKILDPASLFDVVIDSSEVGARKPEPRIYEITREKLGVAHEEIFFVDDIGQNLKSARALGWHTLLFRETDEVLPVLESLVTARQRAITGKVAKAGKPDDAGDAPEDSRS
jgi:putative hydrolase of the HAD superfamily